jgi:pteridine reductase
MNSRTPVALVTGAAQRIGAAIARELHGAGCAVVLHYRSSADAANALAEALDSIRADSCHLLRADLAQPGAAESLAARALAWRGRLDLLVNNASAFYPTPIGQATETDWDALFGSNLRGPFFLSQALAPALREARGAIVNIVDVHARVPLRHHAIYTMAKAGLGMMTRALALDLAPQVRVNGVAPGAILWPAEPNPELGEARADEVLAHTALGRLGDPSDIAVAVRFLGLYASYVTGQVIAVDGGRSLYGD